MVWVRRGSGRGWVCLFSLCGSCRVPATAVMGCYIRPAGLSGQDDGASSAGGDVWMDGGTVPLPYTTYDDGIRCAGYVVCTYEVVMASY